VPLKVRRPFWERERHVSDSEGAPEVRGKGGEASPHEENAGEEVLAAAEAVPFEEDGRADVALDFVIDVLAAMGMDCTVDLLENEDEDPPEEIRLEIEGKDAGRVIGKKG